MHTKGRFGPQSKTIRVESNDPSRPVVTLRVQFVSRSLITVEPRRTVLLQGVTGDPVSDEIWLRRSDGEPLVIREATSTRPGIEVRYEKVGAGDPALARASARPGARRPQPGDWRVVIEVAPSNEPRTEAGELRLLTDHPEVPRLDLPLRVRIRPRFQVLPPRLSLRRTTSNVPFDVRVAVRHNASRRFRITGVRLEPAVDGVAVDPPSTDRLSNHVITLKVTPGAEPRHAVATLRITTRDKGDEQVVEVPFVLDVGAPRRPAKSANGSLQRNSN